tara:strand:- start:1669 stop:2646 length:978 start_codon:yes stop_codon:yes gene_type:complete
MGAKTGYADVILRVLGLRPGQGADRYLWCEPDDGVRLLLHAYTDRALASAAAEIIRSWKDEEPRALWKRLRAEGPAKCPPVDAREVARWAFVAGGSLMGIGGGPYGGNLEGHPGTATGGPAAPAMDRVPRRLEAAPTIPATITPDARKVDPREVARWVQTEAYTRGDGQFDRIMAGEKPPSSSKRWDWSPQPDWVARRADALQTLPAIITNDARPLEPVNLPPGTVAYMDPPYQGTTPYAHLLPREDVVAMARRWADAGALVCISEAEPIPELMADGWHAVEIGGERVGQKRTFSKQQAEWVTMSRAPAWRPSIQAGLFRARVDA